MKKCPYCAEEIQDAAIKCKHCGEMLTAAAPASIPPETERLSQPPPKRGSPGLKVFGVLLMIVGISVVTYFFKYYDTSVSHHHAGTDIWAPDRVVNIGLMQDRQNGIIIGLAIAGAGFASFLAGHFVHRKATPNSGILSNNMTAKNAFIAFIMLVLMSVIGILLVSAGDAQLVIWIKQQLTTYIHSL
jgi:hypothetical protein